MLSAAGADGAVGCLLSGAVATSFAGAGLAAGAGPGAGSGAVAVVGVAGVTGGDAVVGVVGAVGVALVVDVAPGTGVLVVLVGGVGFVTETASAGLWACARAGTAKHAATRAGSDRARLMC